MLFLVLCSSPALAHEVRPAYLALRQTAPDTYDVLWKVPGLGDNLRLGLSVELPAGCTNATAPRAAMINKAFTERWTVTCPGGLTGGRIHIAGLSATLTDVLARVERLDGGAQVTRLTPAAPSFVVEAAPSLTQLMRSYGALGIEHIIFGIDHLLFVLGLLLLVRGTVPLLKTITAFTIAHSITLSLAVLGFVHVPPPPVEATISLSILFVAMELVKQERGAVGLAQRYPWVVAGAFGLLHGLGFAGTLTRVGIPQGDIPLALLMFNVGVEVGQLAFVAVFLGFVHSIRSLDIRWRSWARAVPGYAIGTFAAFWLMMRVVGFR
jgi:hydrogenase/urease accessory protein HupE